jgi:DNA-binding transcriptional LysR family regulator
MRIAHCAQGLAFDLRCSKNCHEPAPSARPPRPDPDKRYLKRLNCEFDESRAWERNGVAWKATHWSEREDWILEMCAAGIGFGFLPEYSINHPRVVALKIVEPEFWREVNVVTVRGREHSPAVGGRSCG